MPSCVSAEGLFAARNYAGAGVVCWSWLAFVPCLGGSGSGRRSRNFVVS
jgi:hypothetical protein